MLHGSIVWNICSVHPSIRWFYFSTHCLVTYGTIPHWQRSQEGHSPGPERIDTTEQISTAQDRVPDHSLPSLSSFTSISQRSVCSKDLFSFWELHEETSPVSARFLVLLFCHENGWSQVEANFCILGPEAKTILNRVT